MVNIVNSLLSLLLPFAFTPLVKYNCSEKIMGPNASGRLESILLYSFAFLVWLVNAVALSAEGGGYFGDFRPYNTQLQAYPMLALEVSVQVFFAWWNFNCIWQPIEDSGTQREQSEDVEGDDD